MVEYTIHVRVSQIPRATRFLRCPFEPYWRKTPILQAINLPRITLNDYVLNFYPVFVETGSFLRSIGYRFDLPRKDRHCADRCRTCWYFLSTQTRYKRCN